MADSWPKTDSEQASDARLVIPMKWLPATPPVGHARGVDTRTVIDVDAEPAHQQPPHPIPAGRTDHSGPRLQFTTVAEVDEPPVANPDAGVPTALAGWAHVISTSPDSCLLVNTRGRVLAASFAAAELLGDVTPDEMVGRHLLDGILHFADFDSGRRGHVSGPAYVDRIPPLLAVATEAPARGLLRITGRSGEVRVVDALAAPVHDPSGAVLGAVSFLSVVSFD